MSGEERWYARDGVPLRELVRQWKCEDLEGVKSAVVAQALGSAVRSNEDWRRAQETCLAALASPHPQVRRAAALCLGELAALRKRMDLSIVRQALAVACEDEAVSEAAHASLRKLEKFAS